MTLFVPSRQATIRLHAFIVALSLLCLSCHSAVLVNPHFTPSPSSSRQSSFHSNTSLEHLLLLDTASPTQNEPEDPTILAALVTMFILVLVGALQYKAPMLWSESRMLRKLRVKLENMQLSGKNNVFDDRAANSLGQDTKLAVLYISLSKGRHRLFSRMYSSLYLLAVVSTDGLVIGNVSFANSEAILALRILIYFGSFTVLGARPLTTVETLFLLLAVIANATAIVLFGAAILTFPKRAQSALRTVRIVLVFCSGIQMLVEFWTGMNSSGGHISNIVNRVRKQNQDPNQRQLARLSEMCRSYRRHLQDGTGTAKGPYWPLSLWESADLLLFFVFTVSNPLAWGEEDRSVLPTLVAIESLEFVATVFFFINESQSEPTLFVELLRAVETPIPASSS